DLSGVEIGRDSSHRGGFVVSYDLSPTGIPTRRVTVQFQPRTPNTPHVFVDGPTDSPHRYDDDALCMWHPMDPPGLRWAPAAGAADLVARVAVHLIKEEWYRHTGEWIGEEVGHHRRDDANDPENS